MFRRGRQNNRKKSRKYINTNLYYQFNDNDIYFINTVRFVTALWMWFRVGLPLGKLPEVTGYGYLKESVRNEENQIVGYFRSHPGSPHRGTVLYEIFGAVP